MSSFNNNIDFAIIWKKINSELTPKEEKAFNNWLNSDTSHKIFFEKILYYQQTGEVKDKHDLNIIKAWKTVEPHLQQRKEKKLPEWIKVAASVAATVFIMLSVYYFSANKTDTTNTLATNEMVIPPGTSKARLIFDDGEIVDLTEGRNFHGDVDGATILNKGNQISYTGTDSLIAELKYNTLEIPRGAEYFVILSDSTKVWLNSDSRLRYPVQFIGDERQVELTGEAYFEVSKNADKPFRVSSAGQVIEVLGTQFNISSYNEDDLIYTTLVEGKVKVYTENNPGLSQNLVPGYQSTVVKENGNISIRKVDVDEFIAWKDGKFNFNNRTLEEMMNTISRWYDISFEFTDENKKNIRFTGVLKRYQNLEPMLKLIEETNEIKFEKKDQTIIVK
ncbi:MAG: FecR family protein [Draconibacterium sp.]